MPPLLLEALLAAAACSAPASPTVCNTSDFPYPACQPSCAGESGGVKCVGGDGRQQRQQLPMAHGRGGSGSSSRGGCLNCTGVVCTMSVPSDTAPPETSPPGAAPGPGRRVQLTATGWGHTKVRHTLLLPEEFELARREPWPMLVELPGNGCGFGGPWPRDCGSNWTAQGWGVSQGRGAVWLTLPFVTRDLGADTAVQTGWWGCSRGGEPFTYQESCLANDTYTTDTTLAYLKAAIRDTIGRFHVDRQRIILLGHSRGAIATQKIKQARFAPLHQQGASDLRVQGQGQTLAPEHSLAGGKKALIAAAGFAGGWRRKAVAARLHRDGELLQINGGAGRRHQPVRESGGRAATAPPPRVCGGESTVASGPPADRRFSL